MPEPKEADLDTFRFERWKKWKGGDSGALDQLLESLKPITQPAAERLLLMSQLPRSYVESTVSRVTIQGLGRYDPSRGVKLTSFVVSTLPAANRPIMEFAQVARMPEERRLRVGAFQSAEGHLKMHLGRQPTLPELQDELMWSAKEVQTMRRSLRPEVSMERDPSASERSMPLDAGRMTTEALTWVRYELTPEEMLVYEGLTGLGAQPRVSTDQLAQRMGKTPYEIRKLRESVVDKVSKRLEVSGV